MNVLHINASPRLEHSCSLAIANEFLTEFGKRGAIRIDRLDLFDGSLATGAKMALFTGQQQTAEEVAAWLSIRAVFNQLEAADLIVINSPLWNNGLPYKLKQYIDLVTQPGWAFGFDPAVGYAPLLTGKSAVLVQASGVWFDEIRPNFGSDFSTPYLKDWLTFIGLDLAGDIKFQPTVLNADVKATVTKAKREAIALAQKISWRR
jgi:FMN-dependent NADH-azoreductase